MSGLSRLFRGRARPGAGGEEPTGRPRQPATGAPPPRRRGAWPVPRLSYLLLGLLTLAIIGGPALRSVPDESGNSGYIEIVKRAIAAGLLYADPTAVNADGVADGRVRWSAGADISGNLREFRRISFLDADMESLDPAIWRYDGLSLALDSRAHLVSGIASSDGGWQRDILFADGDNLQTLSGGGSGPAAILVSGGPTERIDIGAAPQAPRRVGTVSLWTPGRDGLEQARLIRVGNGAILFRHQRGGDNPTIRVQASDGRADSGNPYYALQSGDVLLVEWRGRSMRMAFENRPMAISQVRRGAARLRDPSLETIALSLENAASPQAGNLTTTLQRRLHESAQFRLTERARALQEATRIRAFRAAAVLMDGRTGEIRGLPTFPYQPSDFGAGERVSRAQQNLLRRNSNFVRMPVGSTAKVPMSFAILNQIPELGGLEIEGRGGFSTLMGVWLGANVEDHVTGRTDFARFLYNSSNEYAASLMMLAMSERAAFQNADAARRENCDPTRRSPVFLIGGQPWRCRPESAFMRDATLRADGNVSPISGRGMRAGPWIDQLSSLFCINPNGPDRLRDDATLLCGGNDPGGFAIWRSARAFNFTRPRLLAAVSPDGEDFRMNSIDILHQDYLMTILGGNRGYWTTIGLAQAYARIVSGHPVNARLIAPGRDEMGEEEISFPRDVSDRVNQVRGLMLPALRQVVEQPGATASMLNGLVPAEIGGDRLAVFAKTGTANIAIPRPDARALLQRFADAGCGLRLVAAAARREGAQRQVLEVDEATAASEGCQRQFGAEMSSIRNLVGQLNETRGAVRVTADAGTGRVTRIPPDISFDMGTGHMLVFVVGRYPAGATSYDRPCSLRVAAVNFQARMRGTREETGPALFYARDLLRDPATRAWMLGEPCPAQAQAQGPGR